MCRRIEEYIKNFILSLYNCSGDYKDVRALVGRIVSYLSTITLREVIIAGTLNLKMAALCFVSVTEKVINTIKIIKFRRAQKTLLSLE